MNVILIILIVIGTIFVGAFLYGMFLGFKEDDKELPDWFTGNVYEEGDEIINPFSGEKYKLTAVELSVYDLLMGVNYLGDHRGWTDELVDLKNKAEAWFKKMNPKLYDNLIKVNVKQEN